MSYQSKREKIDKFIKEKIIPLLSKSDLNYNEVVKVIMENCFVDESMVQEELKRLISFKKLKEIHILTIPDEEVGSWVDKLIKEEKEDNKKIEEIFESKIEENGK